MLKIFFSIFAISVAVVTAAAESVTVSVSPEYRVLPANRVQRATVRLVLSAPRVTATHQRRAPLHLAIVLDRSGSMHQQRKLANAKSAARTALALLDERDTFALITYDSTATVKIPATRVTEAVRAELENVIDSIQPGGATALFAGLALGANELDKMSAGDNLAVRRLLLLSDGQANVGPASAGELGRYGAGLVKKRISVSTIGVGSDYNEDLMIAVAQNSDGNFYFVENSGDLGGIFEKELQGALTVAVQQLKLRIVCPRGVVPRGVLGYQCRIDGQTIEMDFNQLYRGVDRVLILEFDVPPHRPGTRLEVLAYELAFQNMDVRQSSHGAVTLEFSDDEAKVKANFDPAVSGSIALRRAAQLREDAIRNTDAGNFQAGRDQLMQAQELLESNAAVSGDPEVKREAVRQKLDVQNFAPSGSAAYKLIRKEIRGRNYQQSNSQSFQQE